jgi:hypothetical protein
LLVSVEPDLVAARLAEGFGEGRERVEVEHNKSILRIIRRNVNV